MKRIMSCLMAVILAASMTVAATPLHSYAAEVQPEEAITDAGSFEAVDVETASADEFVSDEFTSDEFMSDDDIDYSVKFDYTYRWADEEYNIHEEERSYVVSGSDHVKVSTLRDELGIDYDIKRNTIGNGLSLKKDADGDLAVYFDSVELLNSASMLYFLDGIEVTVTLKTYFEEISEKMANASDDAEVPTVITLERDVDCSRYYQSSEYYALGVPEGRYAVLDLAGHKIRYVTDVAVGIPVISVSGSLVLRDSSSEGTGAIIGNETGGVSVNENATFTMEGGNITGSEEVSNSGVYVSTGATFTMDGGKISGNSATNGGGVYVSGGTFIMNDGTICDNIADYGGGVYVGDGSFVLNGGSITENSAENNGGGIHGTVEINDGSVCYNTSKENGGGISGCVTMNGGNILYNTAKNGGGISSDGYVTINGGTICYNTAEENGGGVNGGVTLDGEGVISNNNAKYGGGIYALSNYYGDLFFKGGSVIKNNAEISGGGVYCDNAMVYGGVIKDNKAAEKTNNLFLMSDSSTYMVVRAELPAGTSIGVSAAERRKVVAVGAEYYDPEYEYTMKEQDASKFFCDDSRYSMSFADDQVTMTRNDSESEWDQFRTALAAGGSFKLDKDYICDEPFLSDNKLEVSAGKEVILDLNGHKISRSNGDIFSVEGELTIKDTSDAGTGCITGSGASTAFSGSGALNMLSGEISDCSTGVAVAKFSMSGGKITGNSMGVSLTSGREFGMSGGVISGNDIGVYIFPIFENEVGEKENPVFRVSGNAVVSGNDKNVYFSNYSVNLNERVCENIIRVSGELSEKASLVIDAFKYTGGITIVSDEETVYELSGSDIDKFYIGDPLYALSFDGYFAQIADSWEALGNKLCNCSSDEDAPTLIKLSQDYKMTGSEIELNVPFGGYVTLDLNGHSIYCIKNSKWDDTTKGSVSIGGQLTLADSSVEKTGQIRNVSVKVGSGGIFILESGTIKGKALYNNGEFRMNGGTLTEGSGVSNNGKIKMTGGHITGNTYGVYVRDGSELLISGSPDISGNGYDNGGATGYRPDNVGLSAGTFITVDGSLDYDANIHVNKQVSDSTDTVVAQGYIDEYDGPVSYTMTEDDFNKFRSDDEGTELEFEDNKVVLPQYPNSSSVEGMLKNLGDNEFDPAINWDFTYDKTPKTFDFTLWDKDNFGNDVLLTKDVDYTVSYEDNIDAGEGKIIIAGKGRYTGRDERTFSILPKEVEISWDMTGWDTSEEIPKIAFDGEEHAPVAIVTSDLCEGDECDVVVRKPRTDAGVYTARAFALSNDNYAFNSGISGDDLSRKFEITKAAAVTGLENTVVHKPATATYVSVEPVAKMPENAGTLTFKKGGEAFINGVATLASWSVDESKGTVTAAFSASSSGADITFPVTVSSVNYEDSTFNVTLFLDPVEESGEAGDVLAHSTIDPQTYTGYAVTPEPKIYWNGKELVPGEDYTLSYKNNINVASKTDKNAPSVIVKGKGLYDQSITINFDIVERSLGNGTEFAEGFSAAINDVQQTGKEAYSKPVITYAYDGKQVTLKENRDYKLSYAPEKPMEAGAVTVTVSGSGNFKDSAKLTYNIIGKGTDYAGAFIPAIPDQVYTGSEITPTVTVQKSRTDTTPVDPALYTVTYSGNVNVGKATATIHGKEGHAELWKSVTFKITAKPVVNDGGDARVSVALTDEVDTTYDGKAIKPGIVVKDIDTNTVIPAASYSVSYKNNTKAAKADAVNPKNGKSIAPTITIKFKGNYKGSVAKTFEIKPEAVSADLVTVTQADIKDTGNEITKDTLKPSVKYGKKTLKKNTDYTVEFTRNTAKQMQEGTIKLCGNYSGTIPFGFRIYNDLTTRIEASADPVTFVYTGSKIIPSIVVTANVDGESVVLKEGKDYSVKVSNNVNAAKADDRKAPTWKVTGKGAYRSSTSVVSGTFTIEQKEINDTDFEITVQDMKYSNGKELKPKVTIKPAGAKALKVGKDFTVVYENNKDIAEKDSENAPVAIISGSVNYKGTIPVKFRIYETDVSTLTYDKIAAQTYTGEQIKPAFEVYSDKAKKNAILPKSDTNPGGVYVIEYGENISTGYGTVTVKGVGKYGGSKTFRFKIAPKRFIWKK